VLKLLLVVVILAVVIYAVVRLLQQHGDGPGRTPAQPPPRPIAPDDDASFLRDLDRQRRQRDDSDS
jgi:hypothetical protein